MTVNAPIDFEVECCVVAQRCFEIIDGYQNMAIKPKVVDVLMALVAAANLKVEAQTIERCCEVNKKLFDSPYLLDIKMERLYGPKSDKEEGKL